VVYAKDIDKTPKNEVFHVFLLKKNTGRPRTGTSQVLWVSTPWIWTLPVKYPYSLPAGVSNTRDLHYRRLETEDVLGAESEERAAWA
jgi:hypothetical protein